MQSESRQEAKLLQTPPNFVEDYEGLEPIYETLQGWEAPTHEIKQYGKLPQKAQDLINFIEDYCSVKVDIVSVGPSREATFSKPRLVKEELSSS